MSSHTGRLSVFTVPTAKSLAHSSGGKTGRTVAELELRGAVQWLPKVRIKASKTPHQPSPLFDGRQPVHASWVALGGPARPFSFANGTKPLPSSFKVAVLENRPAKPSLSTQTTRAFQYPWLCAQFTYVIFFFFFPRLGLTSPCRFKLWLCGVPSCRRTSPLLNP
jgi:hypothetical protein